MEDNNNTSLENIELGNIEAEDTTSNDEQNTTDNNDTNLEEMLPKSKVEKIIEGRVNQLKRKYEMEIRKIKDNKVEHEGKISNKKVDSKISDDAMKAIMDKIERIESGLEAQREYTTTIDRERKSNRLKEVASKEAKKLGADEKKISKIIKSLELDETYFEDNGRIDTSLLSSQLELLKLEEPQWFIGLKTNKIKTGVEKTKNSNGKIEINASNKSQTGMYTI